MKIIFIILSVLFAFQSGHSQENSILKIAFSDASNFDITTMLENKRPQKFYVLSTTAKWNGHRFHIDDNLNADSVIRSLDRAEHSIYKGYIFRDSALNRIFTDQDKKDLYRASQALRPGRITTGSNAFQLIPSFQKAKKGFLFSVAEPFFSQDKQYAFIDITTYKKDDDTKELNDAYFALTMLVYQYEKDRGWVRIKKFDYLVL
jgi:hypothetical protein